MAIMAAIGNSTKHGFLVREGDALERLAKVSKITFDKTGTLTYGTPKVVAVKTCQKETDADTLYQMCASAEQMSEHPLGKAVVSCYKESCQKKLPAAETFEMLPGRGVSAVINGKMLLAGNEELMQESGVEEIALMTMCAEAKEYLQQGCTIIYIAVDQKAAGYIALSDTIREESTAMIDQLTVLGVQPVLLTGDHENAAKSIADQLHISEVHAGCLPEDKLNWIADYQKKEEAVCMIGDGVNDAPPLKRAPWD